jgi:small subunit ribosomal protein S7
MPRRARAFKREVIPDARFRSSTVARLITKVMVRGKKRTAENIVYGALDLLGQQVSKDPVAALEQAVRNATPLLQVKPRRVGGATYQVPVEVQPDRGLFLALSWLVRSARARKGKAMMQRLADELTDAFQGQGVTIKRREDTHKMAEANRAFAHYRW